MSKQVIVYSTTWCAFCKAAKQYFDSKGIDYDDIDVEQHAEEGKKIVEETGQMGVPVIRIGKELIVGFDRPRIDAALAKL